MDAVSDPEVEEVVGVFASQTGKTDCVLNVLGFHIQHDPAPILMIQPTVEMAETWSKDRFAPMQRDTAGIRRVMKDPQARNSGNTILHKTYPGGHLSVAGANSPAGLASRPIRVLLCDELDRYPPSAGSEGDPVRLAARRTSAFWNAKRVYISSPGIKGASRIETPWKRSDQRYWYVPCPECDAHQTLVWTQVKWDRDGDGNHLPETARYECEHCGADWSDAERRAAVNRGEWRATRPFRRVAGFRINALCAPWEKLRLEDFVIEWLEAQGNPELLKVFVNTVLAEWWEGEGEGGVAEETLMARREDYAEALPTGAQVPAGAAVLTIGVDVQKDRLEYEITGWGRDEESWLLKYGKIYGNVKTDAGVLEELDEVLAKPWIHSNGHELYIRAGCIDTGYATQAIYKWARPRLRRALPDGRAQFVFGIKGRSEFGRPVWPDAPAQKKRRVRAKVWILGVDAAKEQVYGRLGIAEPGPGYCHFPLEVGSPYFKGLNAEESFTEYRGGRPVKVWKPKVQGAPNEPLDCRVYSYAGIVALQSEPFLLKLEAECARVERDAPKRAATGSEIAQRRARAGRRMMSRGIET